MKLTLYMYIAQPRRGYYEASIPWIEPLSHPIAGSSPSQLKEELMFRVMELIHNEWDPSEIDRLLSPVSPYLTSVYIDIERQVNPDRPKVRLTLSTHVIVGGWEGEDITRLWLPKIPGTCLTVNTIEDMYATVHQWATHFGDATDAQNFEGLQCNYVANLEQLEVDFGFPSSSAERGDETEPPGGRLKRPETLSEVATNLSHRIEDDTLGRAFGREKLVDDLVEVMTSATPASVCLVGPPGVGKSALVHEAAQRAFALSKAYQSRRDVWQSSGDRIIAGMSIIGQWEKRTEGLCKELDERGDVLFLENLIGIIRAGRTKHGESNVARFIEPYLEQNRFGIITEATEETYALARSIAPGFVDKFRRVQVPELDRRDTLSVVTDLIRDLESAGQIKFSPDGVEAVLHLTKRFFLQEAYPGKAVRLVRQTYHDAQRRAEEEPRSRPIRIDADWVADLVHRQTGLPMTILKPGTGRTPDEVLQAFSNRVFSQPHAMEIVTSLVVAIEQGLTDPEKPLASLLLIGPSGVGKTETAKALAADLFGSDDRMIRFDMSEFSESTAITRLIGTPRQPDGELTGKVRLQPFCVLLFDEIEKAHPVVLDLLLQILGDGRLTDASGRLVDFRNTIIVMTSNLGATTEDRWLGFSEVSGKDRAQHYRTAAEQFFRPEIFNRIDSVIPYRPLGAEALRRIARRTLQNLLNRRGLREAQVMVDVDEGLIDVLAGRSVDARYGARTLAHRIERTLIYPLAHRLSDHDSSKGLTRVYMTPNDDAVDFVFETIERAAATEADLVTIETSNDVTVVVDQMRSIADRIRVLSVDPRVTEIRAEHELILQQINEVASKGKSWPADLAESLRRRGGFIDSLGLLERRIQGLQDPRGTGEFILASTPEDRKSQSHRWARIATELSREVVWLNTQLDALATDEKATVLSVTGLSGTFVDGLSNWYRWIGALSTSRALEPTFVYRNADGWFLSEDLPEVAMLSGFAVCSEEPGVRRLFNALTGYYFAPLPPSHGAHTLLLNRSFQTEKCTSESLLEVMRQKTFSSEERFKIEFEHVEGQLADLRFGTTASIPEDRGENLENFMTTLAMRRIGSS